MTDKLRKPLSPLRAAKPATGVHVSLEVGDALSIRPDLTEEQAAHFMDRHAEVIALAMLKAGTDALNLLLEEA